jgi:hypothetical protein
VVAFWASFGPRAGLYEALRVLPAMSLLRAPVRFGAIVAFALSVLAGFGVRRLAAKRAWVGPVAIVAMAVELAAVPWPLKPRDPEPEAYRLLATLPRGPVAEFLFYYRSSTFFEHTRYMIDSTYHWQPLVNGYSDLTPPDFYTTAEVFTGFPDAASFALMHRLQVRYVVLHLDPRTYEPRYRQALLARFPPYERYLRLLTTDQDVWLYAIVGWPPDGQAR